MDGIQIGKYLQSLRKYYKITQDELATRLKVSRQAVSKWETGATIPDIELLVQLSDLYGVTINDILKADTAGVKFQKEIFLLDDGRVRKNIAIIGCGRWGTFIAWYLDRIGHKVCLYGRESSKRMENLMATRENEYVKLEESVELTCDLDCVDTADYVVISINSQNLTSVVAELAGRKMQGKTVILCMKGLDIPTGRRLSQVVSDGLGDCNDVAVWLGPGHIEEFCRGIPNCMVLDSNKELVKDELIRNLSSDLIRFYYGMDLIGNEVGAAAKNVIGIAAGMLEGLDRSTLKGALMSRGTNEIAKLIVAMGGNASTVYGLSHLGDYEATLFSQHSHNLNFGRSIVQGKSYDKLAEGYYTAKALHRLGKAYGVELPICEAVYQILYLDVNPKEALRQLFTRSLRNEFV